VISNSYGASKGAGLFLTSTPRSETTDMLTCEFVDDVGVGNSSGVAVWLRSLIGEVLSCCGVGNRQQQGVFTRKR
jgi:hypothetical protein